MAKHPGAFVYNDAEIGEAHDALQAALDEAGPLVLEAPGTIKALQINITINTD